MEWNKTEGAGELVNTRQHKKTGDTETKRTDTTSDTAQRALSERNTVSDTAHSRVQDGVVYVIFVSVSPLLLCCQMVFWFVLSPL